MGYGWIDGLRDLANKEVTDAQFAAAKRRFPVNTPATKESYLYRSIFDDLFGSHPFAVKVLFRNAASTLTLGQPGPACPTLISGQQTTSLLVCDMLTDQAERRRERERERERATTVTATAHYSLPCSDAPSM